MSEAAQPDDIRPVVRLAGDGNRAAWIFIAIAGVGAILLFLALDSRRQELAAPATAISAEGMPPIAAPPPLAVPDSPGDDAYAYGYGPRFYPPLPNQSGLQPYRPVVATGPVQRGAAAPPAQTPAAAPVYVSPGSYAPSAGSVPPFAARELPREETAEAAAQSQDANSGRVRATRLMSPAMTVPQGTVIPAVLETALDSTRPGAVRAIVSRDVRGFDGSRILIPRGSRLYGEYSGELQAGQNRALVQWKRLTRPDGVQIALDSPASDPLGRAGVKGKVDSHFLERFGGAILQSVLDAGVAIASRKASDGTVIVGLPGSTQQVTSTVAAKNDVQRTLRVRQGSSVSVFVARDLDFSPVES